MDKPIIYALPFVIRDEILDLLDEIIEPSASYSSDQVEYQQRVIESMREQAKRIRELLKDVDESDA